MTDVVCWLFISSINTLKLVLTFYATNLLLNIPEE
jgi:hypothetical protein